MSGDVWLESAKLRRKGVKEVEHMNIELRLETPADYAETEKVVREACWNVYAPGCTEHYLVHVMRSSENFVRELAFVAVADSKIVGCVMFVKGTIAGDDGVVRPVQTSNEPEPYALTKDQLERIRRKERQRKHYQKRMARCEKGSRNRAKMRRKVARTFDYRKNVINDFAHQTSHALVSDDKVQFFVLEDLRVKNMTKKPEPKYDDNAKALPNGARAKAGLNRAILSSGWGKTEEYLKYKAKKAGKLVIKVEPAYTSQRCPKCGRVERKNRPSQSVFRCVSCGFESANADYVAAGNILMAGVELIREGRLEPKKVKATLRGKPAKATNVKLGPGWADVMPVEPERCLGKLGCRTRCEAGSPSFQ